MIKDLSQAFLLFLALVIAGCVERFYPEEDDMISGTLVINAHLTNQPGVQVIEISRSAGLISPSFDPVSGSYAELLREDGETRAFYETRPGFYASDLDESFLQTGMSFMIQVSTPDGNMYESVFDKLRPVPEIDSIYYLVENKSYAESGFILTLLTIMRILNTSGGI
jgi:uncharacterized protein DUF4249